jgi:hypothetical protein
MTTFDPKQILSILDSCCETFSFPALDNGYVYLAATRLSLYRSQSDWAMVIEVFGFSPRAGLPDTWIQTFASRLRNRKTPEDYVNREAYERYLDIHPHDDSHAVFPIEEGPWQDFENSELVVEDADEVIVRNRAIVLPTAQEYVQHGIELKNSPQVQVFELCRFLADVARAEVLANRSEQRVSILHEMKPILQLEEWRHPDVVGDERPSSSETFQQLAQVLATGDAGYYRPTQSPNTHWRNWPEGGTL